MDQALQSEGVAGVSLPNVRDIVLVASGKGGVGKSTVTVNLAAALRNRGLKVGVVDADLYGPSLGLMLGTEDQFLVPAEGGKVVPFMTHGIHSMSIANTTPAESPIVWKGSLVAQGLMQLFVDVAWPELDVLLVDMPPGTGDVQLTILEQLDVSGAVVVTTPQRLAVADAERGIAMFHELNIPVFGLIENMDGYLCPCCGERMELFPSGAAKTLAKMKHVSHLGSLPLDPDGQSCADGGVPLIDKNPEGETAKAFSSLGEAVVKALARERSAAASRLGREEEDTAFWNELLGDGK